MRNNKYGGRNSQLDWLLIREGLTTKLADVNIGEFLKERKEIRIKLNTFRTMCTARAHKELVLTGKKRKENKQLLIEVLVAIKGTDIAELEDALRLKTPRGFAKRLIESFKFETQ